MGAKVVERTAPSPTGHLHLGHVFSALIAYRNSQKGDGSFKLRIEDIDHKRCRTEFDSQIIHDLKWLGIKWQGQILRQKTRMKYYNGALNELKKAGLLYPCACTRNDIKNALSAPHIENGSILTYPGTCLKNPPTNKIIALRLNIKKAIQLVDKYSLFFYETGFSISQSDEKQLISQDELLYKFGDFVVARKDIGTSYNLATIIDDEYQQVSHVTRGIDLLEITPIQVLLQKLINLKTPIYHHHPLLYDSEGKKLSKRSNSESIVELKNKGYSAAEIIELAFYHHKNTAYENSSI